MSNVDHKIFRFITERRWVSWRHKFRSHLHLDKKGEHGGYRVWMYVEKEWAQKNSVCKPNSWIEDDGPVKPIEKELLETVTGK